MFHYCNNYSRFFKTRQLIVRKDAEGNIVSIEQVITESNGITTLTTIDKTGDVELPEIQQYTPPPAEQKPM